MLALDAAKYIINRCISFGHPISNLQLQKILYFCQLAHIKLSGKLLFSDEQFEAWQFGPFVRSIYVKYCLYGGYVIDTTQTYQEPLVSFPETLNKVVDKYSVASPWVLVQESHRDGGAWSTTIAQFGNKSIIPNELVVKEAECFNSELV